MAEMNGVRRVFEVLTRLAAGPASFGELKSLGMAAPTLSRLLRVMGELGATERDESGLYRTGRATLLLARAVIDYSPREERLQPLIEELARESGESSAYYELLSGRLFLRAKVEVAESFHYIPVGAENCQLYHGFRIAALAVLPEEEREASQLACPDAPAKGGKKLTLLLNRVRQEGLYHEEGVTMAGYSRLAAPVFCGEGGSLAGTIGITFSSSRFVPEEILILKELLHKTAQRANRLLAGSRPSPSDPLGRIPV